MMPDRDDVIARLEAVAEYHERRARELSAFDAAQTTEAMANEQEGMSVLADAARDALTLLRETWRPMSEAPRDGTPIAAAMRVSFNGQPAMWGQPTVIAYDPDEPGEIARDFDDSWAWEDYEVWFPLPPLPKEEGSA